MHYLGGVVRVKMLTLFAADFACGREPMFSRPICRPDGLAPNKKRKAWNMSSPTGLMTRETSLAISVTCTGMRPSRRSLAGGTELLVGGLD